MTKISPVDVTIYGSCVSRDMVAADAGTTYTLKRYIARQSLISAYSQPAEVDIQLERLPSAFQRRMVTDDFKGSLTTSIPKIAEDSTLLLWDLTDERLGVYQIDERCYVTRSMELVASGLDRALQKVGTLVPFGTDEHFALWQIALNRFAENLKEHSMLNRTVLFCVPWATRDDTGAPTKTSTFPSKKANRLYRRYVQAAAVHVSIVRTRQSKSVAASDHRWGPAPYHFIDETYKAMDAGLRNHL